MYKNETIHVNKKATDYVRGFYFYIQLTLYGITDD